MAATGGCVIGEGRLGVAAGPDGGARLIAGPLGTSGIDPGGTGGGRSVNIWADAGATLCDNTMRTDSATRKSALVRVLAEPPSIMTLLFTENAANSSLVTAFSALSQGRARIRKPESHKPYGSSGLAVR
jgi:hypothetical protein